MHSSISINEIADYVIQNYPGTLMNTNWGERGLFYNPGGKLPKGIYLLTFKEHDSPNDSASNINRGGLYRLNLGISKQSFTKLFGAIPQRPLAGQIVQTGHNFQEIDIITPHPVYGWMAWIAVINPSEETFNVLKPLIEESYRAAVKKWKQRTKGL